MTLKILAALVTISTTATTYAKEETDWLTPYLRSKRIQCDLTQAQLREQVALQLDLNIFQIRENLKSRGSELRSIVQQRDQVEIGVFPKAAIFDFFVLEKVAANIGKWSFPIQTQYDVDGSSNAVSEKGLWFPLTVIDSGPARLCRLNRISFNDQGRKFIPVVDLVFGEPPRVVTSNLAQVMDPSPTGINTPMPEIRQTVTTLDLQTTTAPATESATPPPPVPAPSTPTAPPVAKDQSPKPEIQQATPDDEEQAANDKKKSRAQLRKERRERRAERRREMRNERRQERRQELREERRRERRERRRERRRQRSEQTTEQQSASSREPPKPVGCTENDSPTRKAACALGIIK